MANLNSRKKFHYLYKTSNLKNGKFYYGMHSTNNLEDGYLGSGTALRAAFRKYGKENFQIEILEFFDSREKLEKREKEFITEEMLKDQNCYNLKSGGTGGFSKEHQIKGNPAGVLAKQKKLKDSKWRQWYGERVSKGVKRAYKEGKLIGINRFSWKGKKHTEETKRKIGQTNSKHQKGKNNSQYGTKWITNEKQNKKIKKQETIPEGWRLGRVLKNRV